MGRIRYTDNTLAEHPPGGKVHYIDLDEADRLPTEISRRKSAIKSGGRKISASRKTATNRKTVSERRGGGTSVSVKKVARAKK